uniref:Putative secreted protein n=1 Tax=Anopheles darlingi TaxID=43151 RepID=A0A2M4DQP5_ANODA
MVVVPLLLAFLPSFIAPIAATALAAPVLGRCLMPLGAQQQQLSPSSSSSPPGPLLRRHVPPLFLLLQQSAASVVGVQLLAPHLHGSPPSVTPPGPLHALPGGQLQSLVAAPPGLHDVPEAIRVRTNEFFLLPAPFGLCVAGARVVSCSGSGLLGPVVSQPPL